MHVYISIYTYYVSCDVSGEELTRIKIHSLLQSAHTGDWQFAFIIVRGEGLLCRRVIKLGSDRRAGDGALSTRKTLYMP